MIDEKRPLLYRAFATTLQLDEGKTLLGRFVPFDVSEEVADELPTGRLDIYREGFRRGAFALQVASKEPSVRTRIGLQHTHESGGNSGLGFLGPVVNMTEEDDGLWGAVKVLRTKVSDVEDLLAAGVDGLSVSFRVRHGGTLEQDGVRWRTNVHLDHVALEPKGAYSGARVAQFRAELDEQQREQAAEQAAAAAAAQLAADAEARGRLEQAAADERRRKWDALVARTPAEEARSAEYRQRFGVS